MQQQRPLLVTLLSGYAFVLWVMSFFGIIFGAIANKGIPFSAIVHQALATITGISATDLGAIFDKMIWAETIVVVALVAGIIGFYMLQRWSVIILGAGVLSLAAFLYPGFPPVKEMDLMFFFSIIMVFMYPVTVVVVGAIYFFGRDSFGTVTKLFSKAPTNAAVDPVVPASASQHETK